MIKGCPNICTNYLIFDKNLIFKAKQLKKKRRGKTRVTSYEFLVYELRVDSLRVGVKIQKCELKSKS